MVGRVGGTNNYVYGFEVSKPSTFTWKREFSAVILLMRYGAIL